MSVDIKTLNYVNTADDEDDDDNDLGVSLSSFVDSIKDLVSTDTDIVDEAQDAIIGVMKDVSSSILGQGVTAPFDAAEYTLKYFGLPATKDMQAVLRAAFSGRKLSSSEVNTVNGFLSNTFSGNNTLSSLMNQLQSLANTKISGSSGNITQPGILQPAIVQRSKPLNQRTGGSSMDTLLSKLDINVTISELESAMTFANVTFSKTIGSTGSHQMARTGYKYALTDSGGNSAQMQVFVSSNDPNVIELRNIRFRAGSFLDPLLPDMIDVFVSLAKSSKGSLAAHTNGYSFLIEKGNDQQAKLAVVPMSFDIGEIMADDASGSIASDGSNEFVQPTKFFIKNFLTSRPDLRQEVAQYATSEEKANAICTRALQERQNGLITGYETSDILYQCKLIGMTDKNGLTLINMTRD